MVVWTKREQNGRIERGYLDGTKWVVRVDFQWDLNSLPSWTELSEDQFRGWTKGSVVKTLPDMEEGAK